MKKKILSSLTAVAIATSVISTPGIPLNPVKVEAAQDALKPTYETRSEIPDEFKWKLDHIYETKAAWEADVKKVEQMANDFTAHQGKISKSQDSLVKALNSYSDLMRLTDKVYVYANMSFDVNSTNPDLQELADKAGNVLTLVSEKTSWFAPEVAAMQANKLEKYLKSDEMKPYAMFVGDIIREKEHTLSTELEKLLAQISPLSSNPEDVYGALMTNIKFPMIKDETGKDIQLSRSNFISYMESENRNVRKAAFEGFYSTMEKYQDTFAQTISGNVKAHNINANVRNYDSALEASLSANNVPVEVYDNLVKTVNDNLPLLHRYMELKKKLLEVDELHMYDIYTPIVDYQADYIPYSKAKEMVKNGLKPLGPEVQSIIDKSFNEGWVDVYSTPDKRSGAYQWGAYDTHPYMLLNYQGTLDDTYTIAHEVGHALQSHYTNAKQPYMTSNYPIFTAEVASTLNEALMFKEMYNNAKTKEEKLYLLNQYLENFRGTLFRQTQFAEFEKAIHDMDKAGESLNAEALKKLYRDINAKYYGKTMISDEEIAMEWARVPHFYYNFYVYQYATSFAASQALSKQVMEEGDVAVKRITENFLSAGSSDAPLEVLKAAGVDMSTAKPIEDAMKVFEQTLDEMEKLLEE
ncbi:oligoendopeptidase F [Bacillus solimangrovi]|uniref:Oligopeptidase F n=1 Tax=Bacillus solimangrovi TaxID=1305675 RepID=A0A1E5LAV9_9BACI|nr:oligoendopeptidase F [Bacillus solimangrovi]OEH91203.1 oligoendopeptidase F [Bacillus solimangrovi]